MLHHSETYKRVSSLCRTRSAKVSTPFWKIAAGALMCFASPHNNKQNNNNNNSKRRMEDQRIIIINFCRYLSWRPSFSFLYDSCSIALPCWCYEKTRAGRNEEHSRVFVYATFKQVKLHSTGRTPRFEVNLCHWEDWFCFCMTRFASVERRRGGKISGSSPPLPLSPLLTRNVSYKNNQCNACFWQHSSSSFLPPPTQDPKKRGEGWKGKERKTKRPFSGFGSWKHCKNFAFAPFVSQKSSPWHPTAL